MSCNRARSPAFSSHRLFDELYLQPGGEVGITGLVQRKFYLRGLLDKLGVKPQLDHRHEYKAAKYILTEDHMVEPDREATTKYIGAQFEQLVVGIAEGRGLPAGVVRALVDRAPLLATEAKEAGLVDDLLYRDQIYERVRSGWGDNARTLDVTHIPETGEATPSPRPNHRGHLRDRARHAGVLSLRSPHSPAIDGVRRHSQGIPGQPSTANVSRPSCFASTARAARRWRQTPCGARPSAAIEAGKPVIASMGNVAGSGGYFVAAGCTKIVADPGTITGSIGVVAGKLVTRQAWAKAGITFDDVARGRQRPLHEQRPRVHRAGEQSVPGAARLDL